MQNWLILPAVLPVSVLLQSMVLKRAILQGKFSFCNFFHVPGNASAQKAHSSAAENTGQQLFFEMQTAANP